MAAGHESAADPGRSAHHEACGIEAVLAEVAVVRDMADVVQLGPGTDVRGSQRRTVDRAVAADFHIVADHDIAEVRNLAGAAVGAGSVAKSVAADGRMGMNFAILTDSATGTDENLRV